MPLLELVDPNRNQSATPLRSISRRYTRQTPAPTSLLAGEVHDQIYRAGGHGGRIAGPLGAVLPCFTGQGEWFLRRYVRAIDDVSADLKVGRHSMPRRFPGKCGEFVVRGQPGEETTREDRGTSAARVALRVSATAGEGKPHDRRDHPAIALYDTNRMALRISYHTEDTSP
jgi:hypothetical protein